MSQANKMIENLQPNLEYGEIKIEKGDGSFDVALSFGVIVAKKAAGCLLQPKCDDLVLLSVDMNGTCYILNVLERKENNTESEIIVPGNCVVHSKAGSLELRADHNLHMTASDTIEVASDSVVVNAHEAEVCISKMSLLGKTLHTQVKRITTVAKSVEQSFKRLTQRMENTERFVADHEEVQTGSTRYLVEDTLTTHAGNTLNISEELHTMHAEQIHMS